MPVGAGSIKRAAKKAGELEEKKVLVSAEKEETAASGQEAEKQTAAKQTAVRKPAAKKSAAKKPAAKKSVDRKANVEQPPAENVVSSVIGGTDPQVMDMVLSMRDGSPISNRSEQLGKNERVEVLQEMPIYLL